MTQVDDNMRVVQAPPRSKYQNAALALVNDVDSLEEVEEPAGEPIEFFIDEVSSDFVKGWVWLPNKPDLPVTIEVMSRGILLSTVVANGYREDLARANKGAGCCAFAVPLAQLRGPFTGEIELRALGARHPFHTFAAPTVAPAPAHHDVEFNIDEVMPLAVRGWAWSPERPEEPIVLELVCDDKVVATVAAVAYREDLALAGKRGGYCGFESSLPFCLPDDGPGIVQLRLQGAETPFGSFERVLGQPVGPASAPPSTTTLRFDQLESALTETMSREELFADGAFVEMLTQRLDQLLIGENSILSVDVFDTLLLRDSSSELTRFFEIGGRLADIVNEDRRKRPARGVDGLVARHLATKASYRASDPVDGCREGSLVEIHKVASRLLAGSEKWLDAFVAAEIDYEVGRMAPNEFALNYIQRHRARQGRVALLSDMYMHREHLETMLGKLGIDLSLFDLIVSSADTKVSKASGGAFAIVEAKMNASPRDFVHIGDSLRGDFVQPVEHGWQALHLPLPKSAILARRRDHVSTAQRLASEYGIALDVAMPG